jgi:hypothetical protein
MISPIVLVALLLIFGSLLFLALTVGLDDY